MIIKKIVLSVLLLSGVNSYSQNYSLMVSLNKLKNRDFEEGNSVGYNNALEFEIGLFNNKKNIHYIAYSFRMIESGTESLSNDVRTKMYKNPLIFNTIKIGIGSSYKLNKKTSTTVLGYLGFGLSNKRVLKFNQTYESTQLYKENQTTVFPSYYTYHLGLKAILEYSLFKNIDLGLELSSSLNLLTNFGEKVFSYKNYNPSGQLVQEGEDKIQIKETDLSSILFIPGITLRYKL